jgi:ribosome-associated protein
MNRSDDFNPPPPENEWISKRASGPSRTQRRREALDVLALADSLMSVPDGTLARMPLDEDLRELVLISRNVQQQIARKRQMQFLAKQLRRADDETLETLRASFANDRDQAHRDTARLHRLEALRDTLIAEGDAAMTSVLVTYPQIDRTHLRQLIRQAQRERERSLPPAASREIFRMLRDLEFAASAGSTIIEETDTGER